MKALTLLLSKIFIYCLLIGKTRNEAYYHNAWDNQNWIFSPIENPPYTRPEDSLPYTKNPRFIYSLKTQKQVENIKRNQLYKNLQRQKFFNRNRKHDWYYNNVDDIHNNPTTHQYQILTLPVYFHFVPKDFSGRKHTLRSKYPYPRNRQTIKNPNKHGNAYTYNRRNRFGGQIDYDRMRIKFKLRRKYFHRYVNKKENKTKERKGTSSNGMSMEKNVLNNFEGGNDNVEGITNGYIGDNSDIDVKDSFSGVTNDYTVGDGNFKDNGDEDYLNNYYKDGNRNNNINDDNDDDEDDGDDNNDYENNECKGDYGRKINNYAGNYELIKKNDDAMDDNVIIKVYNDIYHNIDNDSNINIEKNNGIENNHLINNYNNSTSNQSTALHSGNKDELSTNEIDYSANINKEDLFQKYKHKFNKQYNSSAEEETCKKNLFEKIEKLQEISESRKMRRTMYFKPSYSLTLNYLADMSKERFRKLLGYIRPTYLYQHQYPVLKPYMYYYWRRYRRDNIIANKKKIRVFEKSSDLNISTKIDWRSSNCFTSVRKQGDCGSCWAFSATAVLECQYFLKVDNVSKCSLSQQDLIDCSQTNSADSCKGGSMELAYLYVQENLGLNKDDVYPYIAAQNEHCLHKKSNNALFHIEEWSMVQQNDEEALMQAVSLYGPVSAAIDASPTEIQLYEKGILCYVECSRKKVNHGIVVVGYDKINGTDVWIIRNSWGKEWGMDGYAYVCRGTNFCGISYSASFPILKKSS